MIHVVPARGSATQRLKAGQSIKAINTSGTQVLDSWAFSLADTREFMSICWLRPGWAMCSRAAVVEFVCDRDKAPQAPHGTVMPGPASHRYSTMPHCAGYFGGQGLVKSNNHSRSAGGYSVSLHAGWLPTTKLPPSRSIATSAPRRSRTTARARSSDSAPPTPPLSGNESISSWELRHS